MRVSQLNRNRKKRSQVDPISGVLAYVATIFIAAPCLALVVKVPWSSFFSSISQDGSVTAIKLTLWTSLTAAIACLIFGVPLGWWLSRGSTRLTNIIRPIVLAPIALPPTVAGLALLALLARRGIIGRWIYQSFSWQLPFTVYAVIFAGVFVGLPFVVLITESNFRHLPQEVEDAAVIDRASNGQIFRLIAIPQAKSGIITGIVLAWARVLGEFGATMMFAGSLPGTTQTWTMQIYQELDINPGSAYSLSVLLVAIAMSIIFTFRKPLQSAFRS